MICNDVFCTIEVNVFAVFVETDDVGGISELSLVASNVCFVVFVDSGTGIICDDVAIALNVGAAVDVIIDTISFIVVDAIDDATVVPELD